MPEMMLTEPLWPESGPPSTHLAHCLEPIQATEALAPIDLPTMNSLNGNSDSPARAKTPNSIRTVPAEPLHLETSSPTVNDDSRRHPTKIDSPAHPPSKSYTGISSGPPLSWQNNMPITHGLVRSISSEFGAMKTYANGNTNGTAVEEDTNGVTSPTNGNPHWSSAIGRAGQGKSGRVIDRLTSENDALKREMKLDRLRLHEATQAQKMAESRAAAMSAGLERDATEAAFNSMQLKRRDRQLAEARAELDYERRKGRDTEEKAKHYQDMAQEISENCMREVAIAKERAMHFEAAYTTMSCHWPNERAKVDKDFAEMREDITAVVEERKRDDEQITMLRSLGDQHVKQIGELQKQNEAIRKIHEEYKETQDKFLHNIKITSQRLQAEQEAAIEKNKKLSEQLQWALGVHNSRRPSQPPSP